MVNQDKPSEEKPDWNQLVRQRLGKRPLRLPSGTQEEVIAELAAHLEEVSENARASGLTDSAATALALQEVQDWRVLSAQISRARSKEELMNHRTKTLWLPGMLTLLGASLLLMLAQFLGLHPHIVWMGKFAMVFYWHWLVGLPLFGALGAYLSRQAHGPRRARLAAALAPALLMLITMLLILPWALLIDGFSPVISASFAVGLTNWVALPALALLFGAAPFLREPNPAEMC